MELSRRAKAKLAGLVGVVLLAALASSNAAYELTPLTWASQAAASKDVTLAIDPGQSSIHWTLGSTLHTVHGTFAVRSGRIALDPTTGRAEGEIVVDAQSGESGNDGRDRKMHREIIESAKYNEIVFHPDRIEGNVALRGSVNGQIHGTFLLHGSQHEMTVPFQVEFAGDQWKGSAKFTVPYIAWGLKSPSTFFLKADPVVNVQLELAGKEERNSMAK